jgi:hypothetical protein
MFAEAFAMISDDNDRCSLIPSLILEVSEEPVQRRIRIGNFPVVEPVLVNLGIRGRRLVRIVRVVKVQPDEVLSGLVRAEP